MLQISVVIIAKNEAHNIVACIASAKKLSNDIIVVDTGSADDTIALAKENDARVRSVSWTNYGIARNTGAFMAVNDWIFALDADERITDNLAANINAIECKEVNKVYGFRRLNFFGKEKITHGPLGHDHVYRFYNRKHAGWDNVCVHEKITGANISCHMIDALAEHHGNKTPEHYLQKKKEYAFLWAMKQSESGNRGGFISRFSSTIMSFIKAYFIQRGFLDLKYGFRIARINAYYTWYKYGLLQNLSQGNYRRRAEGKIKIPSLSKNTKREQLT